VVVARDQSTVQPLEPSTKYHPYAPNPQNRHLHALSSPMALPKPVYRDPSTWLSVTSGCFSCGNPEGVSSNDLLL